MSNPRTKPGPLPEDDDFVSEDPLTDELVAYLDGELDADSTEAVEAKIQQDPQIRAKVETLRDTWALLDHLPRPEPSPRFTERTMEKIEPIPGTKPTAARTQATPTSKPMRLSTADVPVVPGPGQRAPWGLVFLSIAAMSIAAIGGYFLRAAVLPSTPPASASPDPKPDPKVEDWHLLRNLPLYQHVNDIEFLKTLDHPELFGENSIGS